MTIGSRLPVIPALPQVSSMARNSVAPLAMSLVGGDWVSSPMVRPIPRARSTPVRGERPRHFRLAGC
jgi:hypothetical protein